MMVIDAWNKAADDTLGVLLRRDTVAGAHESYERARQPLSKVLRKMMGVSHRSQRERGISKITYRIY
jgi:hypothetical protein